jgi:hypothetical protein
VPRSAFLDGAREAGGTKTCIGAIAKQKTAAPQGAASLSLAVLESNGRKREAVIGSEARVGKRTARSGNFGSREKSLSLSLQTQRAGRRWLTRTVRKLALGRAITLQRLQELPYRPQAAQENARQKRQLTRNAKPQSDRHARRAAPAGMRQPAPRRAKSPER